MLSKSTGIVPIAKKPPVHEGVDLDKDYVVQPCPFYILLGLPSSGKSTTISELLLNPLLYFKKFEKVLFITPSGFKDLDLELDDNWYPSLNIKWIYDKIKSFSNEDKTNQILLVFDDCVSEMNKLNSNPDFTQLFYNRRHLFKGVCVSIILSSQYWTKIPMSIRSLHTGLFIFKTSPIEIDKMSKEVNLGTTTKTIVKMLSEKEFAFIYLNLNNNKKYLNFESEIII